MVKTSYLRVYLPVGSFPEEEREQWLAQASSGEDPALKAARRWLIFTALPEMGSLSSAAEGAFVREVAGVPHICPWRTRLRMLAGLLAFRNSLPDEVADVFVPEDEARKAAHELAELDREHPEVRSHILHANWHVPLRWFAAFDGSERILIEDRDGLRLRYEASLSDARARLEETIATLDVATIDDSVVEAVKELLEWIKGFPGEGLLELDYGSVAGMFPEDELAEDHSVEEVRSCVEALRTGDIVRAGKLFGTLTDRWTALRAHEVLN